MVVFDHRDPGTHEADWRSTAPWAQAAPLDLDGRRLVVLAAHPDDETLGAGGLIATAADRGIDVDVIVATGDDARRLESAAALAVLAPAARLRFLGLPDGALHERAVDLERMLRHHLDDLPGAALVVAPWWEDGHGDHEVLGATALRLRRPGRQVLGYPVWLWHWGDPAGVDASEWRRLDLSADVVARKTAAIARHRSQLAGADGGPPMLHEGMLAHFGRDVEVFIRPAPTTERETTPPSWFDARFDAQPDPWGFETRWYERRKRDLLLAALPSDRYARALELGCANGSLTVRLKDRVDELVAVDGSPAALRRARERIPSGVTFEQRTFPAEWPDGLFDLIVFSEVGFYLSLDDLDTIVRRIEHSLTPDGVVLACHWRRPMGDGPLLGDDVHAALRASTGLLPLVRYEEDEFLLDVFAKRP